MKQFGNIVLKAGSDEMPTMATNDAIANNGGTNGASPANGSAKKPASQPAPDFSTPIVHIKDVARVEMGAQSYDQNSRLNGQPAAGIGIFQLPGSNALSVADAAKRRMQELKRRFPARPGIPNSVRHHAVYSPIGR